MHQRLVIVRSMALLQSNTKNVLERAFNPLYSDGVFHADKNNKGGAFLYKGFTG